MLENREDKPAYPEVVGGEGEARTCGTRCNLEIVRLLQSLPATGRGGGAFLIVKVTENSCCQGYFLLQERAEALQVPSTLRALIARKP